MTQEEINEFQLYLQMYDKGLLSKKRVLAKLNINWEDEKKEIEKDITYDNECFARTRHSLSSLDLADKIKN